MRSIHLMIVSPVMTRPLHPGRLAIGTAPLGGLYAPVDDTDAARALEAALARGVTHFDTAPHYGRGLAESRLGAFLARHGDDESITVSTKVGRRVRATAARTDDDIFLGAPPGESIFDFSGPGIRAELDESRERLGRDFIDVVLIHDPDDHLDEIPTAAAELVRQRDAGTIGAIGIGTNSAAVALHALDVADLDVVLLAGRITLLNDSGEAVAARCARDGVTLFAAGVFASGILAGGDGATYDYLPAPETIRTRVAELTDTCTRHGVSLHAAAINHARRINGVTTTLVGVRSAAEATAAADALATDLPDGLWAELDALRAGWSAGTGTPA